MGAISGALYSLYQSADKVEEQIRKLVSSSAFKRMRDEFTRRIKSSPDERGSKIIEKFQKYYSQIYMFKRIVADKSIIEGKHIRPVVDYLLPDINIEDMPLPYSCICTDIASAEKVVCESGSLRTAVMGSISIPGVIEPMKNGGQMLTDGGSVSLVPVEEVRDMGARYVIGIDVSSYIERVEEFKSGLEIFARASRVTGRELHKRIIKNADLVISPPVKGIYWADFNKLDYCITAGESAAYGISKKI